MIIQADTEPSGSTEKSPNRGAMSKIESLKKLQTRIREATGPDRKLDWAIATAFYPRGLPGACYTTDPDGLGACVALMREALPGCVWVRSRAGNIHVHRAPEAILPIGLGFTGANDCLKFLHAIIAARIAIIAEEEAKEKADV